jgi:hypothetical protein
VTIVDLFEQPLDARSAREISNSQKIETAERHSLRDAERATLGEIAHRLGRKVLGEVANVARPHTILA